MVILGGALLLTPGFITDIVGFVLLIPPTRACFRASDRAARATPRLVRLARRVAWRPRPAPAGPGRRARRRAAATTTRAAPARSTDAAAELPPGGSPMPEADRARVRRRPAAIRSRVEWRRRRGSPGSTRRRRPAACVDAAPASSTGTRSSALRIVSGRARRRAPARDRGAAARRVPAATATTWSPAPIGEIDALRAARRGAALDRVRRRRAAEAGRARALPRRRSALPLRIAAERRAATASSRRRPACAARLATALALARAGGDRRRSSPGPALRASRSRAVISDFGGVLTTPLMRSFAAFQDQTGISGEALGTAMQAIADRDGAHPLFELETGRITEADFLDRLARGARARARPPARDARLHARSTSRRWSRTSR